MDLLSFLKREHGHVNALLEKIADTSEGAVKTRDRLFDEIKTELTIHAQIEEKHLYPRLKKEQELKDLEKHAEQEHGEVKKMLAEMAKLPVDGEAFIQKIEALTSSVQDHVEEEEQEILPKAEKLLGKEECDRVAKLLQEEKQKLMQAAK
jgi:hemerythrin-like domain-containing protein